MTLQLPYPTAAYSIYLPETGVKLNTTDLVPDGSIVLGGQTYAVYSTSNLQRATTVSGKLAGVGPSATAKPLPLNLIGLAAGFSDVGLG